MRLRELLDVSNSDERMFIDRILVEKIADNAATNLLKIRKDFSQQPDFVHCEQRLVNTFPILHHVQNSAPGVGTVCQHAVSHSQSLPNGDKSWRIKPGLFLVSFGKG